MFMLFETLYGRLTRVPQGGADAEEDEDDDFDEEAPVEKSAASSVAGTKRSREEDDEVTRLAGEDHSLEDAEEGVAKKARTAADDAEDEVEV